MGPSVRRVQAALEQEGIATRVVEFTQSARTAEEAADAIGTTVGRIVKSLVFLAGGEPVVLLCAGDRRVDPAALGEDARRATADEVRAATGFAIGGVPPLGHERRLRSLVDASFGRFETVWCAAGTPHAVFPIAPADLARLAGARVVSLAAPGG